MNKEDLEYERKYSHSHCWNQGKSPACGQPLKNHKQCCLCDTVYKTRKRFPPQPNSEWKCECFERENLGEKVWIVNGCPIHDEVSPKPEENTYEKISKETERSARLASDKMSGYPLPDTTEEKIVSDCHGDEIIDEYGDKLCGSCNRVCNPVNNTSNEWEKWVKVLANSKNPRDTDLLIVKIKVLLDESEQRVRKEMVEQVEILKEIIADIHSFEKDGEVGTLCEQAKKVIINLISK